jgi:hypothetical protein
MKDDNESKIAWDIWDLMVRLSVLIWDRYEGELKLKQWSLTKISGTKLPHRCFRVKRIHQINQE